MPELRRDPLSGRWVIIAPERALRPSEILPSDPPPLSGFICPFCPENEHLTPPELYAERKSGPPNGAGWSVRVFPNRYPALRVEERGEREAEGFYDRVGGVGAHEVIVDTPHHAERLGDATPDQVARVMGAIRNRIHDLRRDGRMRTAVPFKNQGAAAGATIEHSHCQLIALPLVPQETLTKLQAAYHYYEKKERCLFCDILRAEERGGPRFVASNDSMVALAPFASRVPFETWILPRLHGSHFEDLSDTQVAGLGELLRDVLYRIDKALGRPAFNLVVHTTPVQDPAQAHSHWYVEILPMLTREGGFEWGTGSFINPTPPEEAAEFLRKVKVE